MHHGCNSHMRTPCEQTDMTENVTLLHLRWWAVIIFLLVLGPGFQFMKTP